MKKISAEAHAYLNDESLIAERDIRIPKLADDEQVGRRVRAARIDHTVYVVRSNLFVDDDVVVRSFLEHFRHFVNPLSAVARVIKENFQRLIAVVHLFLAATRDGKRAQ
jgi:hypothetical protein